MVPALVTEQKKHTDRPKAKTSVGVHFRTQRKVSQSVFGAFGISRFFPLSAKKKKKTPSTNLRQKVIVIMSNIHKKNPLLLAAHRSKISGKTSSKLFFLGKKMMKCCRKTYINLSILHRILEMLEKHSLGCTNGSQGSVAAHTTSIAPT